MNTEHPNVEVRVGDMFASGAQTLVNTVNTEGVMGKGIALEFKRRFPEMYRDYLRRCELGEVRLGRPYLYRGEGEDPWIVNFPTKAHWRSLSRLSDIEEGLDHLRRNYREWGIESLAVPPLGCGHGGLEWRLVGRILFRKLREFGIPIFLYAPYETPSEELSEAFLGGDAEALPLDGGTVRVPSAWVAIAEIVGQIDHEPYRWPVGRTMFQKIAYFATEAGLPTHLDFVKGSYGPFSSELNRMKASLVNNGLLAEEPLGKRMMLVKPGPALADARDAYREELGEWSPIIERVADIILRMDTRRAEAAATAHFAANRLAKGRPRPTELDVLEAVKTWKARRRPALTDEEVAIAIRNLLLHGWIDVEPSPVLPLPRDLQLADLVDASAA